MDRLRRNFDSVWLVDFEFSAPEGERPTVACLVAREFFSGRLIRLFADELRERRQPPFAIDERALFVAFYASAEISCFLSLGWPVPLRILDLWTEQRCRTNGLGAGWSLLATLNYYGLDGIAAVEKDEMRALAMRGGPYTQAERVALLDYCQSDVDALAGLLPVMLPGLELPLALYRGRYMAAAARMESAGVAIDVETLELLRECWGGIKTELIRRVDVDYGVYVPTGQRKINPDSILGRAILDTAADWEIDPHQLAEAVDFVWSEERGARAEFEAAKRAARKATGLTARRITQSENQGHDYATWPGLDATARELAGEYPELGLGYGFESGANYDDSDQAGRLWNILRQPDEPPKPKYHADILYRAATLVKQHSRDVEAGPLSFNAERFGAWLIKEQIPWPRTPDGRLALDSETFRQQARKFPQVSALRELRHSLSEMKLEALAVGADGRNRCLLRPFASRSGRNQPSNNQFIFGPSVWLRGLIKPAAGSAVAYVDWSQQELGIAAALSGDRAMMAAYRSGDPYLAFAKQAGAVPSDATKHSHPIERNRFKVCSLAVQYGMQEQSLAQSLGEQTAMARNLLLQHRETYRDFWRWSQLQVDQAMLRGWIQTVFGWRLRTGDESNPRSLANFPMQANGAEMMRLAACMATEAGLVVCAPVHDAFLIEAPAREIDRAVRQMQAIMAEASAIVLDGFDLATDAEIVRWPDRYMDEKRGRLMWDRVLELARTCNRKNGRSRPTGSAFEADQVKRFGPPVQSSKESYGESYFYG